MARYRVEGLLDTEWRLIGEYSTAASMAETMFKLGLSRPDYLEIRVTMVREVDVPVQFHGDARLVQYLMEKCNVTRAVALVALNHNGGSVIHAQESLQNDICKYQYMREVRECGNQSFEV